MWKFNEFKKTLGEHRKWSQVSLDSSWKDLPGEPKCHRWTLTTFRDNRKKLKADKSNDVQVHHSTCVDEVWLSLDGMCQETAIDEMPSVKTWSFFRYGTWRKCENFINSRKLLGSSGNELGNILEEIWVRVKGQGSGVRNQGSGVRVRGQGLGSRVRVKG